MVEFEVRETSNSRAIEVAERAAHQAAGVSWDVLPNGI